MKLTFLGRLIFTKRYWALTIYVLILSALSYLLALGLRFDFEQAEILPFYRLWQPLLMLLLIRGIAYLPLLGPQTSWRYFAISDLTAILRAQVITSILFAAGVLLFRIERFPRSLIFIESMISMIFIGGFRVILRIVFEQQWFSSKEAKQEPSGVIVLGAGDAGHLVVKTLLGHRRLAYRPWLVLDDNNRLVGSTVHGVRVEGPLAHLPGLLQEHPQISTVIVAIPTLSETRFKALEDLCLRANVGIKRIQSFENIVVEDVIHPASEISVETLLNKVTSIEHEAQVKQEISGHRALITGAGGSIGSEIVRQVCSLKPQKVVLYDNSELNLFKLDLEVAQKWPGVPRRIVMGDIRDVLRLKLIFNEEKPELVFHAAAYKHVPLTEINPYEAFCTNVLGTLRVLQACFDSGVMRFVLISSDKAVNPVSVMGCSKRLTELAVQELLGKKGQAAERTVAAAVVRFGNVIDSTGSVVPLFREQIMAGGPITITHPDMERYFMSVQEAVRLVLAAGTLGENGEIFALEMGQKVKIVDIANKMLALAGRKDIPIQFTGPRPGERLSEEISGASEAYLPTKFNKVRRIAAAAPASTDWLAQVQELEKNLENLTEQEVGARLRTLVGLAKS